MENPTYQLIIMSMVNTSHRYTKVSLPVYLPPESTVLHIAKKLREYFNLKSEDQLAIYSYDGMFEIKPSTKIQNIPIENGERQLKYKIIEARPTSNSMTPSGYIFPLTYIYPQHERQLQYLFSQPHQHPHPQPCQYQRQSNYNN